tara:strand:- start:16 stop:402 length:387 start_codon:yes stop_codon:yes gene_type:complete
MIGIRPPIVSALEALKPKAQWTLAGDSYANLQWLDSSQTKPTEEEVNAKIAELEAAEPYKLLREERNKLIAETDWTQLKDIDLDIIRERNWKNYRQALRDLPAKSNPKLNENGDLDTSSVTWPDKPST